MIKKGLAVAVILLFIGVAFTSSINASVIKDELVEFDVEFCGLGKKHTVKLTQQEADEIDKLFDDIKEQLDTVETIEETEEIFKGAVVELDKYGLLGVLSVSQAQRLVTGKYQESTEDKYMEKSLDENENRFCLITGNTNRNIFIDFVTFLYLGFGAICFLLYLPILLLFESLPEEIKERFLEIFPNFGILAQILIIYMPFFRNSVKPVYIGGVISFGYSWVELSHALPVYYRPSEGWVKTNGLNGVKEWNGEIYGWLGNLFPVGLQKDFKGVEGFTGLRFYNSSSNYFLGYARHVKLDNIHP